MAACQTRLGPCHSCGQQIALCGGSRHQGGLYCQAATAARHASARGLVRSPGDGLLPMLVETGVPYEMHASGLHQDKLHGGHGSEKTSICDEAWVPPEAVTILRANRPLEDRMRALRKFAAWYASRHGAAAH